jgi:hypothetical protein
MGSVLSRPPARTVADRATSIGSGTMARTWCIPVELRAVTAVIAWMRDQTQAWSAA